jgi:ribosomal protein L4
MDEVPENVSLASRNVPSAAVVLVSDLTPYDVLAADRLVFVKSALEWFGEASDAA